MKKTSILLVGLMFFISYGYVYGDGFCTYNHCPLIKHECKGNCIEYDKGYQWAQKEAVNESRYYGYANYFQSCSKASEINNAGRLDYNIDFYKGCIAYIDEMYGVDIGLEQDAVSRIYNEPSISLNGHDINGYKSDGCFEMSNYVIGYYRKSLDKRIISGYRDGYKVESFLKKDFWEKRISVGCPYLKNEARINNISESMIQYSQNEISKKQKEVDYLKQKFRDSYDSLGATILFILVAFPIVGATTRNLRKLSEADHNNSYLKNRLKNHHNKITLIGGSILYLCYRIHLYCYFKERFHINMAIHNESIPTYQTYLNNNYESLIIRMLVFLFLFLYFTYVWAKSGMNNKNTQESSPNPTN